MARLTALAASTPQSVLRAVGMAMTIGLGAVWIELTRKILVPNTPNKKIQNIFPFICSPPVYEI
jgi:hypothetical protein